MTLLRPKCPICGAKAEWYRAHNSTEPRRIYCPVCAKPFNQTEAPKILLFDIETSHIKANLYHTGKQVVRHSFITDDFFMLSWAGKWLYGKESFGAAVTPREARARNDKRIAGELHKVIQQAHYIITYNGDKFDIKKINWRFLMHNFKPANQYLSIDLYRRMKDVFSPASLAMDYVCKELGYNGKHHTDGELWDEVEAGDQEAINRMYEYNVNDVWMMEDLYPRVRGWFKTHPNFAAFLEYYQVVEEKKDKEDYLCPRCIKGVIHKTRFRLKYQTPAGHLYGVASCPHCGASVRMTRRDKKELYVR